MAAERPFPRDTTPRDGQQTRGVPRAVAGRGAAAGARWVVLCGTGGGTLPAAMGRGAAAALAVVPGDARGIHAQDETGHAVAKSLRAGGAGLRQVRGTPNGPGARCGNASVTTLIPALLPRPPCAGRLRTGVSAAAPAGIARDSRMRDDIVNQVPRRAAPCVGASAYVPKAGLHARAIPKDPAHHEHVPPEAVGSARGIPMSDRAGQANLRARLAAAGIAAAPDDAGLTRILQTVQARGEAGFAHDGAHAPFDRLARGEPGLLAAVFAGKRARGIVERRRDRRGRMVPVCEAVVVVKVGGTRRRAVCQNRDERGTDRGAGNAPARALVMDRDDHAGSMGERRLVDFRVRLIGSGTGAVPRFILGSEDGQALVRPGGERGCRRRKLYRADRSDGVEVLRDGAVAARPRGSRRRARRDEP